MNKNRIVYIVEGESSAKALFSEKRFLQDKDSVDIVSTHCSADDFLSNCAKVNCRPLSSYIDSEDSCSLFAKTSQITENLLSSLDGEALAPLFATGLLPEMPLFFPLYRYLGKLEYYSISLIINAMKGMLADKMPAKVCLLRTGTAHTSYLGREDILCESFTRMPEAEGIEFEVQSFPSSLHNRFRAILDRIRRVKGSHVSGYWRSLKQRVTGKMCHKPFVIFLGAPYELSFLLKEKVPFTLLYAFSEKDLSATLGNYQLSAGEKNTLKEAFDKVCLRVDDIVTENFCANPEVTVLANHIKNNFKKNAFTWIEMLVRFHRACIDKKVKGLLWANPTAFPCASSLLCEYGLRNEVPIMGAEHGGSYGNQNFGFVHFDSDFCRCNRHLTFGWDSQTIRDTYGKDAACEFLPVGKVSAPPPMPATCEKKDWDFDIVYPITNSLDLRAGSARILPHELHKAQCRFLEHLASLGDRKILVKLPPAADERTFCNMYKLSECKNLIVEKHMYFSEVLRTRKIGAILMDYPSSPLWDSLGFDTELFMLYDDMGPFGPQSRELLDKRVHTSENVDDVIRMLDSWLAGTLSSRRDHSFYEKYVYKRDCKESIQLALAHEFADNDKSV